MNGTMVNKERIDTPIGLLPGDEIGVSAQKFLFVLHDLILRSSDGPGDAETEPFLRLASSPTDSGPRPASKQHTADRYADH